VERVQQANDGAAPRRPAGAPRLAARGVVKRFGDFVALDGVDLELRAGAVHALVGSNGSGKSTLVKIITGVHAADGSSRLEVNGAPITGGYDTRRARDLGVRTLHQDSPLVDAMRVEEIAGLFYGFPVAGGWIRWRGLRRATQELLDRVAAGIGARDLAGSLTPAERATVGLALAPGTAAHAAPVIILDEPTSPLSDSEAERFLHRVRTAAAEGAAVLLVTHRLGEVASFCDEVTVLRGGAVVHRGSADIADAELVAHMVGPEHSVHRLAGDAPPPERFAASGGPAPDGVVARVTGVSGVRVDGVDLTVRAGEIVGVTAIADADATELGRLIAGVDSRSAGTITIGPGALPARANPRRAAELGVAYLPAERLKESGIAELTVRDNLTVPAYGEYWRDRAREREDLALVLSALDVRPPEPGRRLDSLSGGNQQKALLGKWLLRRPRLLVLDSPTIGVDPAAREQIFALLRALTTTGTAAVLVSNEPEHLERLCDRVVVLDDGRVHDELTGDRVNEGEIRVACIR
jgi:ribose transport system ATP-binding protein